MSNNNRRRGGGYQGRNNNRFGGGSSQNSSFGGGGRNSHNSGGYNSRGGGGGGGQEQPDVRLCKFFLLGGVNQCQSSNKPGGCQFARVRRPPPLLFFFVVGGPLARRAGTPPPSQAHALQRVADVHVKGPSSQGGGGANSPLQVRAVCSWKDPQGSVHIFTGSKDGFWRMWDAMTWSLKQEVKMEGEIQALEVEAGHLMCGYEGPTPLIPGVSVGMVRAWNLSNPASPYDFRVSEQLPFAHLQRVYCCKMVVSAAPEVYTGGHEGAIHCWGYDGATNTFPLKCKLEGHVLGVTALCLFNSNGNFLLSGSLDKTLRIWSVDDPAKKDCAAMLTKNNDGHAEALTAVACLNMGDSKYFLTGSMDSHLKVWNASGGCDFTQKCNGAILALCVTSEPANKAVVVVGLVDGTVELRQPDIGFKLRATLSNRFSVGHSGEVRAVCAGDGYFCSVGADAKLMVWQWVAPLPLVSQ